MDPLKVYKKNGYIVVKQLIPQKSIDSVLSALNQLLIKQLVSLDTDIGQSIFENLIKIHNNDIDLYKKIISSLWRSLALTKLMHNEKIIDYLQDIFCFNDIFLPGGQVIHIQSKSLMIPNGYFGFEPHQDYLSVQGSLDGLICWIPLVDIDEDNYPLEIIPGSHLKGLFPLTSSGSEPAVIDPKTYSENDFKSVVVEKGDVVFMSYFTIHRSGKNGLKNNVRIAVSTRFDNGSENTFIRRGFPTAYERNIHRNLIDESFPSKKEILSIFL
jgi:ectoine hydroxylase-related dioxygenase (phytanoyl-CoA dioxygenase family)